jgi:hypothetical protein
VLTTYNPTTGMVQNTSFPGLSTVANSTYGGIAAFRNYVYLSDMNTFGNEPNGIVRFDINTLAGQRFPAPGALGSGDYIQVAMGYDGLLYGLGGSAGFNVFNPITMAYIRSITLNAGSDIRDIAVDAHGDIFALDFDARSFTSTRTAMRSTCFS